MYQWGVNPPADIASGRIAEVRSRSMSCNCMTRTSQQECRGILEFGCTQTLNLVWSFSDIANALMAIPNLICMLILSKEVAQDIKAFQPEIDNRHTEKRSEQNTYVQDVK